MLQGYQDIRVIYSLYFQRVLVRIRERGTLSVDLSFRDGAVPHMQPHHFHYGICRLGFVPEMGEISGVRKEKDWGGIIGSTASILIKYSLSVGTAPWPIFAHQPYRTYFHL